MFFRALLCLAHTSTDCSCPAVNGVKEEKEVPKAPTTTTKHVEPL
jgi:hypothetical protein